MPRKISVTKENIIKNTKIRKGWVEVPLYNSAQEIVAYTKVDLDIWEEKYKGLPLNMSNYGYARYKSDFVHYNIIGKPDSRWIFIDHINRNRLDNRRCNLRFVEPKENCRNSATYGGGYGKSGMRGVVYVKGRKTSPWRVSIFENRYKGKCHAKYFKTLEEARAYRMKFPL